MNVFTYDTLWQVIHIIQIFLVYAFYGFLQDTRDIHTIHIQILCANTAVSRIPYRFSASERT